MLNLSHSEATYQESVFKLFRREQKPIQNEPIMARKDHAAVAPGDVHERASHVQVVHWAPGELGAQVFRDEGQPGALVEDQTQTRQR